jgi:hypothetical protein
VWMWWRITLETSGRSPWGESSFSLLSFMNATSSKDPSLLQIRPSLSTVSRNAVWPPALRTWLDHAGGYTRPTNTSAYTHTRTHTLKCAGWWWRRLHFMAQQSQTDCRWSNSFVKQWRNEFAIHRQSWTIMSVAFWRHFPSDGKRQRSITR